jgi:hypothetical protein
MWNHIVVKQQNKYSEPESNSSSLSPENIKGSAQIAIRIVRVPF